MIYNDEILPSEEIISKMNNDYVGQSVSVFNVQTDIPEMTEYRQKAELEDIFRLLTQAEEFFKWLEGKSDFEDIEKLLKNTMSDKITTQNCCGRRPLDYRYACDKDFDHNCKEYCKCEMEIIDKVIKILSLKNSIVDKQCMIKLLQSRMDALRLIFGKCCK